MRGTSGPESTVSTEEHGVIGRLLTLVLLFVLPSIHFVACSREPVLPVLDVPAHPRVLLLSRQGLILSKQRIAANDSQIEAPVADLRARAQKAMETPPQTVIHRATPAPSGDPHDYASNATYYWPNPETDDGLPWISRDGVTNPDSVKEGTNKASLTSTCESIYRLALAWYLLDEDTYGDQAIKLIRTWFVDPATRMNPHLKYAQKIPGKNEGSRFGIIDGSAFPKVVDAILLLEDHPAWDPAMSVSTRDWFSSFLEWLLTSEFGKQELAAPNNHGSWCAVQVLSYALFTEDTATSDSLIREFRDVRIKEQIARDGTQPLELKRTRTFVYHVYNLDALFNLAQLAENGGWNLWDARRQRLRKALDYVAPYLDETKVWPHPETQIDRNDLMRLVRIGARSYDEPAYEKLLNEHASDTFERSALQLILPPLHDE